MAKNPTAVEICGMVYRLDSDIDPLELNHIAKYVEEKIKEASGNPNIGGSSSKHAVLACLEIASELFQFKSNHENLTLTVNTKSEELIRLIDSTLK